MDFCEELQKPSIQCQLAKPKDNLPVWSGSEIPVRFIDSLGLPVIHEKNSYNFMDVPFCPLSEFEY